MDEYSEKLREKRLEPLGEAVGATFGCLFVIVVAFFIMLACNLTIIRYMVGGFILIMFFVVAGSAFDLHKIVKETRESEHNRANRQWKTPKTKTDTFSSPAHFR